jgi:hypothetical protein
VCETDLGGLAVQRQSEVDRADLCRERKGSELFSVDIRDLGFVMLILLFRRVKVRLLSVENWHMSPPFSTCMAADGVIDLQLGRERYA